MGKDSKISWTDHTFNPWIGCSPVSAGCAHCYAERDFGKFERWAQCFGGGPERKRTSAKNWAQVGKWAESAC